MKSFEWLATLALQFFTKICFFLGLFVFLQIKKKATLHFHVFGVKGTPSTGK